MARRRGKIRVAGGLLEKALALPDGLHIAAIEGDKPGFVWLVLDGPQMPEQVGSEPEVMKAEAHMVPPARPGGVPSLVWTFTPTRVQVPGGLGLLR